MTDYKKQANDFLHATGTKISIDEASIQSSPDWATNGNHGIKYEVTLSNNKGTYTFNFWDSIHNSEAIKSLELLKEFKSFSINSHDFTNTHYKALDRLHQEFEELHRNKVNSIAKIRRNYEEYAKKLNPTAYDILACLSLVYEDNFEDWASSFGYDTDSITAHKTYMACIEEDRQLRRLFTSEQLEKLEEIQ